MLRVRVVEAVRDLLARLITDRERAALGVQPYHEDPDLGWTAPPAAALPYDADVPAEVAAMAQSRQARG